MNSRVRIIVGLGTNLGQKRNNLSRAIELLAEKGISISAVSSFYGSPPWGIKEQDDFINIAAIGETELAPISLLHLVLEIETLMGRERFQKWGPRLIDIDILDYGNLEIDVPGLQLPHPYLSQRAFVLMPMFEIMPGWVPPGESQTLETLLSQLSEEDMAGVVKLEPFPSQP